MTRANDNRHFHSSKNAIADFNAVMKNDIVELVEAQAFKNRAGDILLFDNIKAQEFLP